MENIPDHPVVQNLLASGYPDGKEPVAPRCPVCDRETDTLYRDKDYIIVGCSECITTMDAYEYYQ